MAIDKTSNNPWADLGLGSAQDLKPKRDDDMGQEQFLKLMLAQMKNQDPMKPMESGEFLTQIAQFSSAKGISDMAESVDTLTSSLTSNQALQASSLIGRTVFAPASSGMLEEGANLGGAIDLPSSTSDLTVTIQDRNGNIIKQMPMGQQPEGTMYFAWDGLDEAGNQMPPGMYRISTEALIDGEPTAVPVRVAARVESVSMGKPGEGITLNLTGVGAVKFNDVSEIM